MDPVWQPCAAMVGLTAAVWVKLYVDRLGEMRARHIDPQALGTTREAASLLERPQAAENFRNLFEVPVLFYVLVLATMQAGVHDAALFGLAWAFVGFRALHSLIQCSYNRVVHRFIAYALATLVLFAYLVRLAWVLVV